MKKLLLLLLIVPMISFGQTKRYKVTDKTIGDGSRGRTYEIEDKTNPWDNPPEEEVYSEAEDFENLQKNIKESADSYVNSLSKIASSPGFQEGLAKQAATRGLSYLGNGTYNLRYIWPPPFGNGKKSIKRAKKQIEEWIKNLRTKRKTYYKYEIVYEKGYNGGMGVYHMADVNFVIYNPNGTRALNENQNLVKIRAEQVQKQEQSEKKVTLKKESATQEILNLKKLLDVGVITQEEFDKKATELKKILLGN